MARLVKLSLVLPLLVFFLAHMSCAPVIMVAPPGTTIKLIPNPTFISAHGGVSVITAVLIESTGVPVADGTVVQFFTTLGRIDEQGKTNDGVARVNLVADGRSGTASISAFSGGGSITTGPTATGTATPTATATGTATATPGGGGGGPNQADPTTVTIGNTNAARVHLTANPNRITISRSSLITATVVDAQGNPLPNVPVIFTVAAQTAGGVISEFMDSGGNPVFTDNNGRAQDFLRTRTTLAEPFNVVVVARTLNGIGSDNLVVTIN